MHVSNKWDMTVYWLVIQVVIEEEVSANSFKVGMVNANVLRNIQASEVGELGCRWCRTAPFDGWSEGRTVTYRQLSKTKKFVILLWCFVTKMS